MMPAIPKTKMTVEEYLEFDRKSEERYEYFDGEAYSMSGVSRNHDQIQVNLTITLGGLARNRGCRVFSSDMRIKVPSMVTYRYPDLTAMCGQAVFEEIGGIDILTNPNLIVEVLSDSTERFDRGTKFTHYKSIASFTEYLLVAQDRPHVTQFIRHENGFWLQTEFNSLDEDFHLRSVDCNLTMREVYQDIVFE